MPVPDLDLTDPYAWLEEVDSEAALAWVVAHNEATYATWTRTPAFEALQDRLLAILDSDARIPAVTTHGEHLYNFWRDAAHPRGLWRRTTRASYATPEPVWDVVLDVDALATDDGENWVFAGATLLGHDETRALVSLSRGGADATVVREFDLRTRRFVTDGFTLTEAKSRVSWLDADTLLVATDTGPTSVTSSGYPRQVRRWHRGMPLADAPILFEAESDDVSVSAWHDDTPGFGRTFVARSTTMFSNEMWWVPDATRPDTRILIEKPGDAQAFAWREHLLFELRSDWEVQGTVHRAGSLLATDFDAWMAGGRSLTTVFEPSERVSLEGITATRHALVLHTLDQVRGRLVEARPHGRTWAVRAIEGLPEMGSLSAAAVDSDRSDEIFVTVSDYLTPTQLRVGTPRRGDFTTLKSLPAFFDASGLSVEQHEATSADGTRIPYFVVRPTDLVLDGSHPTLLYGYGGFQVSLTPAYSATLGASWMERGGVYVVANLRGGGEFGPAWHQAALRENRPRAYEDLEAVAGDLITRGISSPAHLGVMGGSNGGLLVGNALVRRPDLWGAVVCQVPLLDMKRYSHLLAGASWMEEYGNPDVPEDWAFLQGFSPYHQVRRDVHYPPVLFMTSTRDDRVHPAHARKMAARMEGWGHDVTYYENVEGGHGGAANNAQTAFRTALSTTWLWAQLSDG